MGVFRIISLAMASETGGPSSTTHPWPIRALRLASPRPLSLTIERQGIWSYVLKRDEARWLHSNSIREMAWLKARVDYLQADLQVAEEEAAEARV